MSGREFCFLHTYEATGKYWQRLTSEGLVSDGCGVRFINPPFEGDEWRFNKAAEVDGLRQALAVSKRALIIDRVAGGSPYLDYDFNLSQISEFESLLGDNFLGGQVHEPISNTQNDIFRLAKIQSDFSEGKPFVANQAARDYLDWTSSERWLEYGTVEDYDGMAYPATIEQCWQQIEANIKRQGERIGGTFCVCEGYVGDLAWNHYYRAGAKVCFAEAGPWSSLQTNFMIAALRGAAAAAGKKWGVYFAPWGPEGCTCFIDVKNNTWRIEGDQLLNSNWPAGVEYGPSPAFQRRSFFHSYLAGADYLHEEWGAEDNFMNWDDGELSPYGQVTREFLKFVDSGVDVGKPYTPIALLQDVSVAPPSSNHNLAISKKTMRGYEPREIDYLWDAIFQQLYNCSQPGDRETFCYGPCYYPEIFDILPHDAPADVRGRYKTFRPEDQILQFMAALNEESPIIAISDLPKQINRCDDDSWVIAIYNPRGATRGKDGQTVCDYRYIVNDSVEAISPFSKAEVLYKSSVKTDIRVSGQRVYLDNIQPGGMIIIKLK